MNALEDVSEIWLVAKAVQDLFESVISSAGYEKTLESGARATYQRQYGSEKINAIKKEPSLVDSPLSDGRPASSKSMPLTPALRIWADAALKSAVTPKMPSRSPTVRGSSSNSSSTGRTQEPHQFSANWNDLSQGSFVCLAPNLDYSQAVTDPLMNYGYVPEDPNLTWVPQYIEGTPAPIGFNAAEW